MPSLTKEDTRRSCAQKADSTNIGNHVGDPPNNDLKKSRRRRRRRRRFYSKMKQESHNVILLP